MRLFSTIKAGISLTPFLNPEFLHIGYLHYYLAHSGFDSPDLFPHNDGYFLKWIVQELLDWPLLPAVSHALQSCLLAWAGDWFLEVYIGNLANLVTLSNPK